MKFIQEKTGIGDFQQTKNNTVFFVTAQQTVLLCVTINT
jgi:hypothetical protein